MTTDNTTSIDLDGGETLVINQTHEGLLLDLYSGDEHLATVGRTFDEWAEWMREVDPLAVPLDDN